LSGPLHRIVVRAAIFTAFVAASLSEGGESVEPKFLQALEYRLVGPFRGGRVVAVAGVPAEPRTFYMGATGGGVWKTTNGGEEWRNVSDGFFTAGSIGALAIAPSDSNVIYAGTGETCLRNNVSAGDGIYRSDDAGRTWTHVGLRDSFHIGRIAIHPKDPDRVYVAALGSAFGPNPERGVYRSTDGGATWERTLFVSDRAGAVDLALDPHNPRVLYAATWEGARKAWTIVSGGPGSGLHKSVDEGDTWKPLTKGLPEGVKGKIGLAVSPVRPERVYALVEAAEGAGLYRSDDAGETFESVNSDPRLVSRAFYYMHLFSHPTEEDGLFAAGHADWLVRSMDAGKSFEKLPARAHGDYHALWINPLDPRILVLGDDGGASVSFDAGKSWSRQDNQPTAEMYRVAVDDRFEYRLYGAQQDNSTVSIASRTSRGGITARDWYPAAGGEQGAMAPSRLDPDVVYSGNYQGILERYDHRSGQIQNIIAYPQLGEGTAAKEYRYRFSIVAPVRVSPHDPRTLYHAANVLLRSRDEGRTWSVASPDLTRDDETKQVEAGTPITRDMTGTEVYCTISAFEESPHTAGLLWAGSDDGRVHVSRDAGASWQDVTPREMPEWGTVGAIEPSAHDPARAFFAVHRYRDNDFAPYVFRTEDYGGSWKRLTTGENGIPLRHFVRTVREDPERKGLLYAGTEYGLYVSFDDGGRWQSLQRNLPVVPVTELVIQRGDLVVSTQGRSFWILDDLSPLHQLTDEVARQPFHLFEPRKAYRVPGSSADRPNIPNSGRNPPKGAILYYALSSEPREELAIEIQSASGDVVRRFSTKDDAAGSAKPETKAGLNRFDWDLRYEPPALTSDSPLREWYEVAVPRAVPGPYLVRLTIDGASAEQPLEVAPDPRLETTADDYGSQLDLALQIRDRISLLTQSLERLRFVRDQAKAVASDTVRSLPPDAKAAASKIVDRLLSIEGRLVEPRLRIPIDLIHFGPKLDLHLGDLLGVVAAPEAAPTEGARKRFADLDAELTQSLEDLSAVLDKDVPALNALVRSQDLPLIAVPKP
jgi:photosystem II stability/assembly factor-like uncharacterized protein